jgi:hypothetical protein
MRRCRSAEERLPFEVKVLRISLEAFGRSDGLDSERDRRTSSYVSRQDLLILDHGMTNLPLPTVRLLPVADQHVSARGR